MGFPQPETKAAEKEALEPPYLDRTLHFEPMVSETVAKDTKEEEVRTRKVIVRDGAMHLGSYGRVASFPRRNRTRPSIGFGTGTRRRRTFYGTLSDRRRNGDATTRRDRGWRRWDLR